MSSDKGMEQAVENLDKEINQRNGGLKYMGIDVPQGEGIWSNEELSDAEEIERAKQRLNYFYYSKSRTNMSKEADAIMEKLKNGQSITREEEFTLICDDPEKVKQWSRMDAIHEKVKNGEQISSEELQFVTETTFGKDSVEGKAVYDKMIETGRVKPEKSKAKSDGNEKQIAEVTRDNSSEHQRTSSASGRNAQTTSEQSRGENKFIQELQQQTYTPEEIEKNDAKAIESPAIEEPVIQAPVTQGTELVI